MENTILHAENIRKTFTNNGNPTEVIREASITIQKGDFIMIVGPSGSGKSTLLYALSGLREPTSGQVRYGDQTYSDLSQKDLVRLRYSTFGFIMQQHLLVPYLDCIENVCLARSRSLRSNAIKSLTELGLGSHTHKRPNELSFGERQRVAVARGLVHNPQLLFADEPTASVNAELATVIVDYIASYCAKGGACVMVTHDLSLLSKANKVFTLTDGLLVSGTPPYP